MAADCQDVYGEIGQKILGAWPSPEERMLTKVVFWSLLHGESRLETEKRVMEQLKTNDTSLVLQRRQAIEAIYPEIGSIELLTKFSLLMELSDLRQELSRRIEGLCS